MDNPSNEQSDEIPEFFLEKRKNQKKENKQKIIWFEKKS